MFLNTNKMKIMFALFIHIFPVYRVETNSLIMIIDVNSNHSSGINKHVVTIVDRGIHFKRTDYHIYKHRYCRYAHQCIVCYISFAVFV